jgi:hypothetical protein
MTRDKRNQAKISALIAILVEEGILSADEASRLDGANDYSAVHNQARDARQNGNRPSFAGPPDDAGNGNGNGGGN